MPNRGEPSRMSNNGVDKSNVKIVWREVKLDVKVCRWTLNQMSNVYQETINQILKIMGAKSDVGWGSIKWQK